jgi:hypothetical protein
MAINYPNSLSAVIPQTANPSFAKTVYVNAVSPSTATIFDLANPPATNDNTLKADSSNIYIGTDGQAYTYNSSTSTYSTYTYPTTVAHGVDASFQEGLSVASGAAVYMTNMSTVSNTTGSAWNPSLGEFTVQRAGWYTITASLHLGSGNTAANTSEIIWLMKNGGLLRGSSTWHEVALNGVFKSTTNVTTNAYLLVGDKIRSLVVQDGGSTRVIGSVFRNFFSIVENR